MCPITNYKIKSLEPQWSEFRGFSLLFDNPGQTINDVGPSTILQNNSEVTFFNKLANVLQNLRADHLKQNYGFCPLSPNSYHVTVWDGMNEFNVEDVNPAYRQDVQSFLRGLPQSLAQDSPWFQWVDASELWAHKKFEIEFVYDELFIDRASVMGVKLKATEKSLEGYQKFISLRSQLNQSFYDEFSIRANVDYMPHVSLGYFANKEVANLAEEQVNIWNKALFQALQKESLVFTSMNVYAFTDMISFYPKLARTKQ